MKWLIVLYMTRQNGRKYSQGRARGCFLEMCEYYKLK